MGPHPQALLRTCTPTRKKRASGAPPSRDGLWPCRPPLDGPAGSLTAAYTACWAFTKRRTVDWSPEIFLDQRGVDRERRFGAFRRGDNHPLHVTRGVAGHVEAGQVRGLVHAGSNGALVVE